MKKLASFSLLSLVLALAFVVSARTTDADIPAPPIIGSTIADFSLPDTSGASHSLATLHGKNGTVLIFIAVQCPVSNAYRGNMEITVDAKLSQ